MRRCARLIAPPTRRIGYKRGPGWLAFYYPTPARLFTCNDTRTVLYRYKRLATPPIIVYRSTMTTREELKRIEELKQLEDNFNESA
jgi:hypothetical protein